MSVEYRFSEPDYDVSQNSVENEKYIIGNLRGESFAWCDFNGFCNLDDVKAFMQKNPQLIIMDESDNIVSFDKFESLISSRERICALPLDDLIKSALHRMADETSVPSSKPPNITR